jgi:hypothetical protein
MKRHLTHTAGARRASAGTREFVAVILTKNRKFTVVHYLFAELVALVP